MQSVYSENRSSINLYVMYLLKVIAARCCSSSIPKLDFNMYVLLAAAAAAAAANYCAVLVSRHSIH